MEQTIKPNLMILTTAIHYICVTMAESPICIWEQLLSNTFHRFLKISFILIIRAEKTQ